MKANNNNRWTTQYIVIGSTQFLNIKHFVCFFQFIYLFIYFFSNHFCSVPFSITFSIQFIKLKYSYIRFIIFFVTYTMLKNVLLHLFESVLFHFYLLYVLKICIYNSMSAIITNEIHFHLRPRSSAAEFPNKKVQKQFIQCVYQNHNFVWFALLMGGTCLQVALRQSITSIQFCQS